MMQSMKGATMLLGSMNRQMNLPALQRITMEFERENEIMDERQEMMDDAIDEATGMEDDEAEGEDIVKEVLDEIGVDLTQMVRPSTRSLDLVPTANRSKNSWARRRQARYRKNQQVELGFPRLSAGVVVGKAAMLEMMTSKLAWTASDDDDDRSIFCSLVSRCAWSYRLQPEGCHFASASFHSTISFVVLSVLLQSHSHYFCLFYNKILSLGCVSGGSMTRLQSCCLLLHFTCLKDM